jgi:hypothetical protein
MHVENGTALSGRAGGRVFGMPGLARSLQFSFVSACSLCSASGSVVELSCARYKAIKSKNWDVTRSAPGRKLVVVDKGGPARATPP